MPRRRLRTWGSSAAARMTNCTMGVTWSKNIRYLLRKISRVSFTINAISRLPNIRSIILPIMLSPELHSSHPQPGKRKQRQNEDEQSQNINTHAGPAATSHECIPTDVYEIPCRHQKGKQGQRERYVFDWIHESG